jgi:hypothetical protein
MSVLFGTEHTCFFAVRRGAAAGARVLRAGRMRWAGDVTYTSVICFFEL